ncbi:MAG: TlpA family protein disulfide reductase [Clostridiales bacterium]|nr:TlpA family protein disulfide reductase [Clostridiales bacterium]
MKKKLVSILTVLIALSLSACSPDKAKEQGEKIKKDLEDKVESLKDDVSKYADDETDLEALTGTTSTTGAASDDVAGTVLPESETESVSDSFLEYEEFTTSSEVSSLSADFDPDVSFSITDMNGNTIDETEFSKHKITMINFWEPWCGPCVSEMPEIEKLYENYKDKGLYVIGVFSATDQIQDVKSVIASAGTTYPIATYDSAFDVYQTGYVPTTIFVDQSGHVIPVSNGYSDKAIVGSGSYETWAETVDSLMK